MGADAAEQVAQLAAALGLFLVAVAADADNSGDNSPRVWILIPDAQHGLRTFDSERAASEALLGIYEREVL